MPFILENNTDYFVTSVFFENTAPSQKYRPPAILPVTETDKKDKKGKGKETPTSSSAAVPVVQPEEETLEAMKFTELGGEPLTKSLAEVLISTLMDVMFLSGFTVPDAQFKKHQESLKKEKTEVELNKTREYGNIEIDLLW